MEKIIFQDSSTGMIREFLIPKTKFQRAKSDPNYLKNIISKQFKNTTPSKTRKLNNNDSRFNEAEVLDSDLLQDFEEEVLNQGQKINDSRFNEAEEDFNDNVADLGQNINNDSRSNESEEVLDFDLLQDFNDDVANQGQNINNDSRFNEADEEVLDFDLLQDFNEDDQGLNINNENTQDQRGSSLFIWTVPCVKYFLTLYEEHKEQFTSSRHLKVYAAIAKKLNEYNPAYKVTAVQCQTKLNGLKKTYKNIIDHNNKSGNDRKSWPLFNIMDELFGSSAWAKPVATASEAGPSSVEEEAPKRKKKKSISLEDYVSEKKQYYDAKLKLQKECMEKIMEQRDRHHREKLEFLCSLNQR